MSSEDELRSAFQKELALITEYCSLKADAFDMRRKLDAEMALARAPVSSHAVDCSGAPNIAKPQDVLRTTDAAAELLEKREKVRAEQEAELRRLREEILAEKQAPPFLATNHRNPSPHSTRSPSPGNRELSEDPSADETVVAPKAAAKGKGGRPSGKGCPPPPPPANRESLPKGKGKGPPQGKGGKDRAEGEKTPGGTRLVNLHWRTSLEPEEAEVSVVEDTYLAGMVEMLPKQRHAAKQCTENLSYFEKSMGIVDAFCLNSSADDRTPVRSPSPQPRDNDPLTPTFTPTHLETTPSAAITPAKNAAAQASPSTSNRRRRRNTIFSGDCAVRELPSGKLEEFFQVRPAAIDLFDKTQRSSMGSVRTLIRDTKHLQIIDILVKKEAIMSKQAGCTRQQSEASAVDALILALRRCDYTRCPPQALEDILKVTSAHGKETNQHNVLQFVDARGEEALQQLDHPQLHRLLYGILQIPAIDSRLECMVMEANSEESFKNCYSNLMTLGSGLMALKKVIEPLKYFFAAMKRLGNMLNQASNASASVSAYGVKMISIERLMQLKSPVRHEVTLFHLLVMNLPSDVLDKLIDPSTIEDLNKAKLARSFTVHQLCMQFLDGFRQIQKLVETGKYKNCDIPIDSRPCGLEAEGSLEGDIFFKNMRTFVETRKAQADELALLCKEVYEKYRAFGHYIDDSKYVYPPPCDDSQATEGGDTKRDLFDFFHWLLLNVKQTRDELVPMKLDMDLEHKKATNTIPVSSSTSPSAAKIDAADEVVARRKEKHVASPVPEAKPAMSLFTSSSMRVLPRNASPPSQRVVMPEQEIPTVSSPKPCESPGRRDRAPSPSRRLGRSECNPATASQHASCMLETTSQLCPPPSRPVVKRLSLTEATISTSNHGLVLPGVQKAGTPTPQASTSGQSRESPTGSKSNGSDPGQASNGASPSNSPTNTTRKCRKSVTNLANKAERQGISRVLGEASAPIGSSRASSMSSPSRSPSPSSDGGSEVDHASSAVGFAAEIREGARMRQGRFFRGQFALELPLGVDDEQEVAWRSCRSPDARTPGTSRYALSPVWENASETSHSMTPARRCRAYENLSPVPLLHNFPDCS